MKSITKTASPWAWILPQPGQVEWGQNWFAHKTLESQFCFSRSSGSRLSSASTTDTLATEVSYAGLPNYLDNFFSLRTVKIFVYATPIELSKKLIARISIAAAAARQIYRENSSTFEIPYFVAKVAKRVAKVRGPGLPAASHPILTPVKLSSQP
ncbi:hypothetical protein AVEN_8380-1 [Araneus ventricosus]|uniref:Uncharacterized protein n=1 Tax=Araneus ventricosus TaxID=182803 RepID=A0A4Y2P8Z4_ARAVE|nr:hypothetical protein AVEN_8380-1 [Araneus ventricosus]